MKHFHAAALLTILLCLALLCACGPVRLLMEDPETDAMAEAALTALHNHDVEAFTGLFLPGVLPGDADEVARDFEGLADYYQGDFVSWVKTSQNRESRGGASPSETVSCVYEVTTEADTYRLEVVRVEADGQNALQYLYLISIGDYAAADTPSGRLLGMGGFNGGQWGLLAFSVLAFAFTIFTLVRCVRDKIRLKPVFVLIILLVQPAASLFWSADGFNLSFGMALVPFSSWLIYPDGRNIFTLALPVGAAVYWFVRGRLGRKAGPAPPQYFHGGYGAPPISHGAPLYGPYTPPPPPGQVPGPGGPPDGPGPGET